MLETSAGYRKNMREDYTAKTPASPSNPLTPIEENQNGKTDSAH